MVLRGLSHVQTHLGGTEVNEMTTEIQIGKQYPWGNREIGQFLKAQRKKQQITAEEMARDVEVSPAYIRMLEAGSRSYTIERLQKTLSCLGVDYSTVGLTLRFQISGIDYFVTAETFAREFRRNPPLLTPSPPRTDLGGSITILHWD